MSDDFMHMRNREPLPLVGLLFEIVKKPAAKDEKQAQIMTDEAKEYIKEILALAEWVEAAYLRLSQSMQKEIELDNNFSLDIKDEAGATALMYAAKQGHTTIVDQLLEYKAQVNSINMITGETALFLAIQEGHTSIIGKLLEQKAEVDLPNAMTGETPLILAVIKANATIVGQLLEYKADVNQPNFQTKATPLTLAAQEGHTTIVNQLLEYKAQVNLPNTRSGITPLIWAIQEGYTRIIELLLEHKANVDLSNMVDGTTPLTWAIQLNSIEIVRQLLKQKANVDLPNSKGGATPLLWALQFRFTKIVEELLEHKAQVNLCNAKTFDSPLLMATYNGDTAIAGRLLELKANIDWANGNGNANLTSLILAAEKGITPIVDFLLSAKADTEVICMGKTALDYAIEEKRFDAVNLLLEKGGVIRNFTLLKAFLNSRQANHAQVNFCFGVVSEQEGDSITAENYFKQAVDADYLPAFRRLGEIREKEKDFSNAIMLYHQAAQRGDKLSLNRLVTIAQKLLVNLYSVSEPVVAMQAPAVLSQNEIKPPKDYCMLTENIYAHLISTGLHAHLNFEQWIFLAADAMGNSYFQSPKGHPTQGIHFALRAAGKANETAKTADEKKEAQNASLAAWRMFHRVTNPIQKTDKDQMDQQEQLKMFSTISNQESISIIASYLDEDQSTRVAEVAETFFRCVN